ncbi:GH3 auxin-responsive promoter family protein [Salmonella enterica]
MKNYHYNDIQNFSNKTSKYKAEFILKINSPKETQHEVLKDLERITKNALYWCQNGANLSNLDDFKKSVCISDYSAFTNAIEKEIITKGGILTNSPVIRWLKTSGTTGNPKYIPYTYHWLEKYRVPAMYAMWDTFISACPHILTHRYSVLDTQTTREIVKPNINGLTHQSISNRYPYAGNGDWTPPWNTEPWYNEKMPSEHDARSYARLRYFIGEDLRAITAINPSMIISLYDKLKSFQTQLIRDLHDGTFNGANVNGLFLPNPGKAKEIEGKFKSDHFTLCDIWPHLKFYSCWCSAGASHYIPKVNKLIPNATIVPFMTCGTEGVITIPICPEIESQPLAINQAIYEFIPVEIEPDIWLGKYERNTLSPMELEVGKRYHIIMSQAHGLLRLWTGDIIEVTDINPAGTPWVVFIERYGIFNSFTGEKLTHHDISIAFDKTFKKLGCQKSPYIIAPKWAETPYYICAIEQSNNIDPDDFSEQLDIEISSINIEYLSKRQSSRLGMPKTTIVKPDMLRQYFENNRCGENGNQHKFKHHQNDSSIIEKLRGTGNV